MAQSAVGALDYRQEAIATKLTLREVSRRTPGQVLGMFACARLHRVKCDISDNEPAPGALGQLDRAYRTATYRSITAQAGLRSERGSGTAEGSGEIHAGLTWPCLRLAQNLGPNARPPADCGSPLPVDAVTSEQPGDGVLSGRNPPRR